MQWDEYKDNFAIDPPNATIFILGGEGLDISDVVVILRSPKLDVPNLTFDIVVLESGLKNSGPAPYSLMHWHFVAQVAAVSHTQAYSAARVTAADIRTRLPITVPRMQATQELRTLLWAPRRREDIMLRRPAGITLIRLATEQLV